MEKMKNYWSWEYFLLVIVVLAFLSLLFIVGRNPDIDFTRRVFTGLIQGKESVKDLIDWPSFKAMEQNVGEEYAKLRNDYARKLFCEAVIVNISLGFKFGGGKPNSLGNWRLYARDNQNTIVAADSTRYAGRTMLFTITKKEGKRKLVYVEWKSPK